MNAAISGKQRDVSGKPERPSSMNISTKRLLSGRLLLIIMTTQFVSCVSISKAVYQTKAADSKIRYYITDNPNYRKGEGKFYARVDSGSVQIFYSFQEDNIYKTYDNVDNYVYTLVFEQQPLLKLTSLDSIVLKKADNLLDSLDYKNLKRPKGAKGFVVEVAGH